LVEGGIAIVKLILKKRAKVGLGRNGFEEAANFAHVKVAPQVFQGGQ
jgi:hypothetical protein